MYDGTAILKSYKNSGRDSYGNPITVETTREVFVQPRGVYAVEFYNASQLGIKPSLTLFLANKEDYEGEKVVEFEGVDYSVIRVDWSGQRDGISLVCEERTKNG